jgi:hypothetical protein
MQTGNAFVTSTLTFDSRPTHHYSFETYAWPHRALKAVSSAARHAQTACQHWRHVGLRMTLEAIWHLSQHMGYDNKQSIL